MRAFLAGFAAAAAVLAIATRPLPAPSPSAPATDSYYIPTPASNAPSSENAKAPDPIEICKPILASLLEQYRLTFDHLSEQIKADARFLPDAIAAAVAPCPRAVLVIEIQASSTAGNRTLSLAERRAASLTAELAAMGVQSQTLQSVVDADKTTLVLWLGSQLND